MNEEVWKIPPANLSLSAENVDVWRVSIDQQLVAEHYALLASPEIARAEKFASQDKAREFIVCRGALRKILGVALDENPRTLVFAYEEHGRPYLPELDHYNGVSFSVSHSYDMALIAASRHRQVGIDIEKIREDMDHENLSRRFF